MSSSLLHTCLLKDAAQRGALTEVRTLHGHSSLAARGEALECAAAQGHADIVRMLLPHCEHSCASRALLAAANHGHPHCVSVLLERLDANAKGQLSLRTLFDHVLIPPMSNMDVVENTTNTALYVAACHGHVECVRLLIPHSDFQNSWALMGAARYGHAGCVALLLPHSNPLLYDSMALQMAAWHGHEECVDMLWAHSDPQQALTQLRYTTSHTSHPPTNRLSGTALVEQRLIAQQQAGVLKEVVGCMPNKNNPIQDPQNPIEILDNNPEHHRKI